MAKKVELVLAIAQENLAPLLDALTRLEFIESANVRMGRVDDAGDAAHDVEVAHRANHAHPHVAAKIPTIRARRIIYTPVGTQRRINKTLESLRKGSLSAFVLADLSKHPGSFNADVRKRAAEAGFNPDSVDTTIWLQVNKGWVKKAAAE